MWTPGKRTRENPRLLRELHEEFDFHIQRRAEELEGQGLTPTQARDRAVAEFGDAAAALDRCIEIDAVRRRGLWRREFVGGLVQDLRFASRALRRAPAFTVAAVLTLGLGISANALLLTAVSRVLLHPLPGVHDRETLVWITSTEDGRPSLLSYPMFEDLAAIPGLTMAAAVGDLPVALRAAGAAPERRSAQVVSPRFFDVLHTSMEVGRSFRADEQRVPAAVISHALWVERFGRDATTLGRRILLNGVEFTVIGVAEEPFAGAELDRPADLWIPIGAASLITPRMHEWMTQSNTHWLTAVARRDPRSPLEEARATAAVIAARSRGGDERIGADIIPLSSSLRPGMTRDVVPIATLAFATTLAILLIAGANVATLLLSRASTREHEIAVRMALGAGHRRIARLLLTESTLLALAGAGLGLVVTMWGHALARLPEAPPALRLGPDWWAVASTLLLGMLCGIACGSAPVWGVTRSVGDALKGGGGSRGERSRLRGALVVGQVALSVMMLAVAGLFLRSLAAVVRSESGFDARGDVLTATFDPGSSGYGIAREQELEAELLRRLESDPAVLGAAISDDLPMRGRIVQGSVEVEGGTDEVTEGSTAIVSVSPGFFDVLGVPVLRGRGIGPEDEASAPRVATVNEEFVRRFGLDGGPVGRRLRLDAGEPISIVGVVGNVRWERPGRPLRPYLFLPMAQRPWEAAGERAVLVRARGNAAALAPRLVETIQALEPDLPVYDVMTMQQRIDRSPREQRMAALTLAAFGALALLLASIGVYGVTSYAVSRRAREIGIRLAMGARPDSIRRLFLWRSGRLVGLGVLLGLLGALGLLRLVASMLVGVSAFDPAIFAAVGALLAAVALVSSWVPARRAMRLEPVNALRSE